jgi:hypothetical protein
MGRANKNINSHTDSRYYRAVDGYEKAQKRGSMPSPSSSRFFGTSLRLPPAGIDNFYCQYKKTYFLSISRLFSLDYSDKLVYCAEM